MHGKRLVSSSPRDWQAARRVWRAWSRQSREVCEIRALFIGRCGYHEGKGVDKKEARGESFRRQALFAVIVKRVSPFSTAWQDGRLCPYKGGSRRVTLEKSLNCGVNYLL